MVLPDFHLRVFVFSETSGGSNHRYCSFIFEQKQLNISSESGHTKLAGGRGGEGGEGVAALVEQTRNCMTEVTNWFCGCMNAYGSALRSLEPTLTYFTTYNKLLSM